MYSKAVLKYAEEFRRIDIKGDFAEAVLNRFKTEGVKLKMIPSIEELRPFVQDMANRPSKAEGETDDGDENWNFGGWCP